MVEEIISIEGTAPIITETTTEVEVLKEGGKTKQITKTKTRLRTKTKTLRETIGVINDLPTASLSVENTALSTDNGIDLVKEFNWLSTENKIIIGSCLGFLVVLAIGAWCFGKFHSNPPPSPNVTSETGESSKKTRSSPLSPPNSAGMRERRRIRDEITITRLSDLPE